jgi:uncharacterized repeat protein (TIGR02543 family)
VRIDFQIGGIFGGRVEPGVWDLNVTSVLIDPQNNLIPGSVSSRLFKVDLAPVSLNVAVPSHVIVSVDGTLQPAGSTTVGVALGQHNITVPEFANVSQSTRLRFDHWDDGSTRPNRTVNLQSDTTIEATFVPQYLLTLKSPPTLAMGAGWYDMGSTAQFSVPTAIQMPGLLGAIGARQVFKGWYEDGERVTTSNIGSVGMFGAHTLTAKWTPDYTIPVISLAAIAAVIEGSAVFVSRRRAAGGERKRKRKRQRAARQTTRKVAK